MAVSIENRGGGGAYPRRRWWVGGGAELGGLICLFWGGNGHQGYVFAMCLDLHSGTRAICNFELRFPA